MHRQGNPVAFSLRPERHRAHRESAVLHLQRPVAPLFSLISGVSTRQPRRRATAPLVSLMTHTMLIAVVFFVLPLFGAPVLPAIPEHFQYILTSTQMPAPPPPPPAALAAKPKSAPPEEPAEEPIPEPAVQDKVWSTMAPIPSPLTGPPVVAPIRIRPESGLVAGRPRSAGGVPGGVTGGVAGGVVGGRPRTPAVPPPAEPVRVGGPIPRPKLIHRVEPTYPKVTRLAMVEGMVILEATVDAQGRVRDVSVIRSAMTLLDQAAVAAVQQWRYEPLIFHGRPTPFQLAVTVTFSIER